MFFFFFDIGRKQFKLAVCRIDNAMQRRGSLNQPPNASRLIGSRLMLGKTKIATCELLNFARQINVFLSK